MTIDCSPNSNSLFDKRHFVIFVYQPMCVMRSFILIAGLTLLPVILCAQSPSTYTIKGKVINDETRLPLAGATVFLSGTSTGALTQTDGSFELSNLDSGTFRLVVSFIGFATTMTEVQAEDQKYIDISLKPAFRVLDEVTIQSGKNSGRWYENLLIFKKYFLGTSENAELCRIANPKVLFFKSDGPVLTATADEPLIIENVGLGYSLTFLLEDFVFNSVSNKVTYKGQVVFKALEGKNEKQRRVWASNRLKAYAGSQLHFMRALYKRKLMDEGFFFNVFEEVKKDTVITSVAYANSDLKVKSPLFREKIRIRSCTNYYRILDSLTSTISKPLLAFSGDLEVTYINEAESYNYLRANYPNKVGTTRPQKSKLMLGKQKLLIQPNGMLLQEQYVQAQGYWGWELVAESLPVDYNPDVDQTFLYAK